MKRKLRVLVMMMLFICISTLNVFAGSISMDATSKSEKINPGDEVEIALKLSDVKDVQEEINTLVGYVKYDENIFEEVGFDANVNCGVSFNSIRSSEVQEHFILTFAQGEGLKPDTQVATIKLKVKESAKHGDTEVSFKNVIAITENNTASAETFSVKLKVNNVNLKNIICIILSVIILAIVILATIVCVLIKTNVIKLKKKECNCKKENAECKKEVETKVEEVKKEEPKKESKKKDK